MRQQWDKLSKVGAHSVKISTINQASMILEMNNHQQELVNNLREDINNQFKSSLADAMMMFQQFDTVSDSQYTLSGSVNLMTSTVTMDTLISTIKSLKDEITTMKTCTPTTSTVTNNPEMNPRIRKIGNGTVGLVVIVLIMVAPALTKHHCIKMK